MRRPDVGTESRRCERCTGAVPGRMSRTRDEAGLLVCEECIKMKTPDWTAGLKYVAAMGEGAEMERRVAEAISSIARVSRAKQAGLTVLAHDSGDNAIINHCPFCGSGAVVGKGAGTVGCDFCHTNFTVQVQPAHPFMPQTVDGQPVPPAGLPGDQPTEMSAPLDPAVNETEEGVVEDATGQTPFNEPETDPAADKPKPADKPKGENPFAKGSAKQAAQVTQQDKDLAQIAKTMTGREFIARQHQGKGCDCPRSMPMCRWSRFWDRAMAGEYDGEVNWPPSKVAYRTAEGHTLDEDAYIARLALAYADDREPVLDSVRTAHVLKEAAGDATVTCPRCAGYGNEPDGSDLPCTSCSGTGLVWVKVPGTEAKQADLLTHHDDRSYYGDDPPLLTDEPIPTHDLLDPRARHDDRDLLADNGRRLPDPYHRPSREWLDMIQWSGNASD